MLLKEMVLTRACTVGRAETAAPVKAEARAVCIFGLCESLTGRRSGQEGCRATGASWGGVFMRVKLDCVPPQDMAKTLSPSPFRSSCCPASHWLALQVASLQSHVARWWMGAFVCDMFDKFCHFWSIPSPPHALAWLNALCRRWSRHRGRQGPPNCHRRCRRCRLRASKFPSGVMFSPHNPAQQV